MSETPDFLSDRPELKEIKILVQTKLEKTKLERHDALTDVLNILKPRGRVFCCSEMSAPWAISLLASGYAHFHVIEHGAASVMSRRRLSAKPSNDISVNLH